MYLKDTDWPVCPIESTDGREVRGDILWKAEMDGPEPWMSGQELRSSFAK